MAALHTYLLILLHFIVKAVMVPFAERLINFNTIIISIISPIKNQVSMTVYSNVICHQYTNDVKMQSVLHCDKTLNKIPNT